MRRPRLLRSRVARLRATHSYRPVFIVICVTFLFASLAGDATWTTSTLLVLEAVTLALAASTSGVVRATSPVVVVLLVAAVVAALALPSAQPRWFDATAGFLSALLVTATIFAIAIGVIDQGDVNRQSITGAICIYILLGIFFLFLYSGIAAAGSADFFAQGTDGTRALRLYFSFVTLATLGYGDYTPAGNLGHTLAVVEALFGQIYLVTIVALLVSRLRGTTAD